MRFLADECIPPAIISALRAEGHDVLAVREAFPSAADAFILSLSVQERRILLTEDNDYGDLIFHRSQEPAIGVILLRMSEATSAKRWSRLKALLDEMESELLGKYVIVGPDRSRVAQLPSR